MFRPKYTRRQSGLWLPIMMMGEGPWKFNPCRKCCPGPGDCAECVFDSKPLEWFADLGIGGWNDDDCDYCDQVSGQYTLDLLNPSVPNSCTWRFLNEGVCTLHAGLADLIITLSHNVPVPGGNWNWRLDVEMEPQEPIQERSIARYETSTDTANENCWFFGGQGAGNKITLDKVSDDHYANFLFFSPPCQDALPAACEIWTAA